MSENKNQSFRKKYEKATIPIGKALAKLKITPSMMTGLSIIVACFSLYYFYMKDLLMALIVIFLAGLLDILDGAIARATGKASKYGTLVDNSADRVVEGILMLGLVLGEFIYDWLGIITLLSIYLPSYIRARGEAEIRVNARGVGIFERKEKLGTLFIGIILVHFIGNINVFTLPLLVMNLNIKLLDLFCIIVVIGCIISSIQRLLFFSKIET